MSKRKSWRSLTDTAAASPSWTRQRTLSLFVALVLSCSACGPVTPIEFPTREESWVLGANADAFEIASLYRNCSRRGHVCSDALRYRLSETRESSEAREVLLAAERMFYESLLSSPPCGSLDVVRGTIVVVSAGTCDGVAGALETLDRVLLFAAAVDWHSCTENLEFLEEFPPTDHPIGVDAVQHAPSIEQLDESFQALASLAQEGHRSAAQSAKRVDELRSRLKVK